MGYPDAAWERAVMLKAVSGEIHWFRAAVEMARRKGTLWQREKGPLCRVVVATWPDGAERREATSRRVPINAFSSVERGPSGSVGRP